MLTFEDINPCYSNPCKLGEDCVSSNDGTMSYICMPTLNNICETMKPCNKNSECIYISENNTFYCKCLNGAETCEDSASLDTSTWSSEVTNAVEPIEKKSGSNEGETSASDLTNTAQGDAKSQSDIPKFGFNYENVILPISHIYLSFSNMNIFFYQLKVIFIVASWVSCRRGLLFYEHSRFLWHQSEVISYLPYLSLILNH
jgi:hypothetical protein